MKKTSFLFFFLFFFILTAFGQDNTIDSLKLALKKAKHDTSRCHILYELSIAANDEEWPHYNQQLLVLAEKNAVTNSSFKNNYLRYVAEASNNVGFLAQMQGDMPDALKWFNKSLRIFEAIYDKEGLAPTYNNIGSVYEAQGDIFKALMYYNKSLKIITEIGDDYGIAAALHNIGLVYKNQGDIPKALEYCSKSLKIREAIKDQQGIASSLNNIAIIYEDQGDASKALEYYNKSLEIKKAIDDKDGIATSYNNIGSFYKHQNDFKKALEYQTKGLKIREERGDREGMANSFNNIGALYNSMKDIPKALEYTTKSLKIYEEIGDKDGISTSLVNVGSLYFKQQNYSKALSFTIKGMELSKEIGFPENIKNAAERLNAIYKITGNYKAALDNYELYIAMRDSITNQENKKASIKSQFKYEYEKKAAADSVKVVEEKKIVAVQLKQEKTQRFALYGGLALVLLFAAFMFNRFRVTQKQKNIIELKEKETQQQNEIITIQKHLVEEKHKEITDSINYAERIQRSFLATKELLDENLNRRGGHAELVSASHETLNQVQGDDTNYFVFFKPKDVVSGDFYWSAKLSNGNFALATADSTGHGVPGAIMSLLNVTSLEKAIEHHTNPADILNHTRQTIIERLKKDGSEEGGKDGMDCSLLVFDFSTNQLLIAAANNPVWIIRENELIEIKPDKMPVGKNDKQDQSFTTHNLELQKGDTIYTLTDGFPDQFGGDKGKKFMSKKLKELLLANVHLPIVQQKELLETTFKDWIGNLEQVDDVTIIGIKV